MAWLDWAGDVLGELSAPLSGVNEDTLNAWSHAESGSDVMRWNNPLNTTLIWAGVNNPMNPVGVQAYPDELVGARATVATLLNGDYPIIVAHLRASVPRQQWGDACAELDLWGTGCGWLNADYGPVPGGVTDLTPEEHDWLANLNRQFAVGTARVAGSLGSQIEDMHASLATDIAAVEAAIADLKAHPAVVSDPSVLPIVQRIEAALKAA